MDTMMDPDPVGATIDIIALVILIGYCIYKNYTGWEK
jgi:hypothetical protein